MIDDYRSLAVFNAVADAGSFSAAARRLRLSTSVVSHHVSKLESKLGVTLLFRSTRSLSLTPEGNLILDAARRMVSAGEEAIDLLTDETDQPVGALRVTVPAFGLQDSFQQNLWQFAKTYTSVALTLNSSDRPIDLIQEGFDLAIRLGQLSDSSLKSRRIGDFRRALVAAPSYLATRSEIRSLDDLKTCEFISFSMLSDEITLTRMGETISFLPENIRIDVDSITAAKSAILLGLGMQKLPLSEVEAELANGTLVEVMPDWRPPVMGVFAVWPDSGPQKTLTRLLIDFLVTKG